MQKIYRTIVNGCPAYFSKKELEEKAEKTFLFLDNTLSKKEIADMTAVILFLLDDEAEIK